MTALPEVVAFVGAAGAGKSAAADILVRDFGYTRLKFADGLKAMLRAIGLTDEHIDGDLKEKPCPLLNGQTPRHAMQTLGTEWGRALIHQDLWAQIWFERACNMVDDAGGRVVCDDLRFPNELRMIQQFRNVAILRVVRPGGDRIATSGHESERALCVDRFPVIMNDQDIETLQRRVANAVRHGSGT